MEKPVWKRRVKQEWPLIPSPLHLELLLKVVSIDCEEFKTYISPTEYRIRFAVQAYADDVIVILREAEGVQRMSQVLGAIVN
jgi:hypothetical protein